MVVLNAYVVLSVEIEKRLLEEGVGGVPMFIKPEGAVGLVVVLTGDAVEGFEGVDREGRDGRDGFDGAVGVLVGGAGGVRGLVTEKTLCGATAADRCNDARRRTATRLNIIIVVIQLR